MKRSLALACLLANSAFGQSLTGDWIGGYRQNDNWIVVLGHFDDQAAELRGTMDIVSANQQAVQLKDVSKEAAALRFRLVSGRREDEFSGTVNGGSISGTVRGKSGAASAFQLTRMLVVDPSALRQYDGAYQFGPDHYMYLQMWSELTGTDKLVAFDERGEVRTLYPTDRDSFFAGPGAALPVAVESRVSFQRNTSGVITSLTWQQGTRAPRVARRVATEKSEDVRFRNGDVQLAGRLVSPNKRGKHPAIVLVHGSGPQNREFTLPFARFLVRRGFAVLGYDKRGVGGSTGDWNKASYEDLAGDAAGAFRYLKTRADIDPKRIGLLGISQAGLVMPLAAVREKDIAFLISISGPGVTGMEESLDSMSNELRMTGMPADLIAEIVSFTKLQYAYARTGERWEEYLAAIEKLRARMGPPPKNVPITRDDPFWDFMRRMYFYDPVPTLEKLRCPTLAIFGGLDNNVVPGKNQAAWEGALRRGGNPDYKTVVLAGADHDMLAARVGSGAEMPSLQGLVPEYSTTIVNWLAARIPGVAP